MAVWIPSSEDQIGPAERVGRRLFARRKLAGAKRDSVQTGFELYHFEAKRDNGEVSVDRLGKTGTDKRIKALLNPICQAAGSKFGEPRAFEGWASVSAKQIQAPAKGPKISLVPSPVAEDLALGVARNDYHAHACRPVNYGSYEMALHLKMIFDNENVREEAGGQLNVASAAQDSEPHPAPQAKNVVKQFFAWARTWATEGWKNSK